ncbi:MAG TPA: heme lyase CcmF/NrfE family subunit [Nocardioidaceae bacterium]|jgi:cytochrome c-type biogenesis protein CcmF|nr:heme lyase CcmF/NrfE family subunit [Nocardioidaceae bacterium]
MISALGPALLAAGFGLSLAAMVFWGASSRRAHLAGPARILTWTALATAVAVVGAMEWALVTHDFSVRYVAENSAREVPVYYRVVGLWAALEGSLLLWLLVLTVFAVLMTYRVPSRVRDLHPVAMATVMSVAVFFFGLALAAGDAFAPMSPVPANGPGPNPLLQDHPLMGVHPPLLYVGYVGLTVPFAYAVAALVTGRTGREWLAATRVWLIVAWASLTTGIVLGSWWSYEVLGWGGYWAWDPVENASILPWFTATALIHSVMVQQRRSILRAWNLSLAASTFVLVLIGTFITRSGVIASVHAFTQSPLGPVLLGYIAFVILGVTGLFVWRAGRLGTTDRIESAVSREAAFLVNNVLFVALAVTVLFGTTFPLLVEAVTGDRVSVGAPYFNRMVVPLALVLVLLMGIGPALPWGGREAETRAAFRRLRLPLVVGLGTVGGLGLAGLPHPLTLVTLGASAFSLAAVVGEVVRGVRTNARAGDRWPRAVARTVLGNRRRYGGLLTHSGVVLAAVAIAVSSSYSVSDERTLAVGESLEVGGYTATLASVDRERTSRFMQVAANTELTRGGDDLGEWKPMLRFYPTMSEAIGRPAVRSGIGGDAYLTVSAVSADASSATVRLTVTPLMLWLWIAGAVMVGGATLAIWPRRRRSAEPRTEPDAPILVGGHA